MSPSSSASGTTCSAEAVARAWDDHSAGIDVKSAELDAKSAELDVARSAKNEAFDLVLFALWMVRFTQEFQGKYKTWSNLERILKSLVTKDIKGWHTYIGNVRKRMEVSCTPLAWRHS